MPYNLPGRRRQLGGGGPAGSSGPSAPTAAQQEAPTATPGYVDFSRIVAANRPAAQAMGQRLVSGVEQQGQAAQQAIQGAQQGFTSRVQAGTAHYNSPNLTGGWQQDRFQSAQAAAHAGAAGGYTGPKGWEDAGLNPAALAEQAATAQDRAKALTSTAGRGGLLREGAAGPYSAGMSALDSELAGATIGGDARRISDLYGGLSKSLVDARAAGGAAVDSAIATSNDSVKAAQTDAERIDRLISDAKASEEQAAQYQAEMRRRYPRGTGGDPRLTPFIPGLYG